MLAGHARRAGVSTVSGGVLATTLALVFLAGQGSGSPPSATLDPSFGQGGEAVVQPNPACASGCVEFFGSHAEALAIASNGSILLAGNGAPAGPGVGRSWLVRLGPNGVLDTSFGSGGYAEGVARLHMSRVFIANNGDPLALVSREGGGLGLERFTGTGALDGSFGVHGVRWLQGLDEPVEGAMDARGRIVVLSRASVLGGPVVTRYLASGALDTTFGHRGVAHVALPEDEPEKLAVEPGGATVVVGGGLGEGSGPATPRLSLARLTSAGKRDRGFGRQGVVAVSPAFSRVAAVAVGPDREILLAQNESPRVAGVRQDALVVGRYTAKGVDASFGVRGIARTKLFSGRRGVGLEPHAIAFDDHGDAVVVGERRYRTVDVPNGMWFLAGYTRRGRDCAFGTRGFMEGSEGGASAVAIQRDQRIVIAGWGPGHQPHGAGTAYMAARYVASGSATTCPGEGRKR
jgi:uncharacterized delta-60 repeat protein